jgi:hypothetical protein
MQAMLLTLEQHTAALDGPIRESVAAEKQDVAHVQSTAERLRRNDYGGIAIGDYHVKREHRSKAQEANRAQYEVRNGVCSGAREHSRGSACALEGPETLSFHSLTMTLRWCQLRISALQRSAACAGRHHND